ncbi:MAG TPA: transcriptional regulator [Bacteroidales bacterium]|nr:MAG: hypothetical protein A2W98_04675 [Bacteroidetes bacterium GWF2_33_38]OFY73293.1 MAG: hypothetical protein A2265_05455 [Bacteroidetes bacterium RIFOXYA12_FULL_33_9]OFY89031.1 MAG: hypothetical protein A2236_08365 [Bacteroidetes bacterium RIFOXYA2_FULL_33_7]HBF88698.1 transcriptional regulator [Bacteroidales bacterium]
MRSRIEKIIKEYALSSSIFADEIKVQRAQISHIISGRNNPSLDIAQKILLRFPGINPEWLILGTGKMLKSETTQMKFNYEPENVPTNESIEVVNKLGMPRNIAKIVIFFDDNTFQEYYSNR